MVVYQHERVELERVRLDVMPQLAQEAAAIVVIEEDPRPAVSTGGNVVDRIRKVDPWRAWHSDSIAKPHASGKCKMKEKKTRNGLRLLFTFENVKSIKQALETLTNINE